MEILKAPTISEKKQIRTVAKEIRSSSKNKNSGIFTAAKIYQQKIVLEGRLLRKTYTKMYDQEEQDIARTIATLKSLFE